MIVSNNLTKLFARGFEKFLNSHTGITVGPGDPEPSLVLPGNVNYNEEIHLS